MIEFEHLFQFVAFGMYGTLSKTAEILHVSQPTLTRNMKLLEKEFGVILFARSKNHIALNENGLLAIKEARKILSEIEVMTDKVRQLDRSRHTLSLGSCAPYPVMDFVRLATELYPSQSLTTELRSTEPLLQGLRDGRYNVIILPFKPTDSALIALPFGKESLYFNLPKGHPQEKSSSLSFSDLDGTAMIVYSHIGFWKDLSSRKQCPIPVSCSKIREMTFSSWRKLPPCLPSLRTVSLVKNLSKIGRLSRLWTNRPRLSTLLS